VFLSPPLTPQTRPVTPLVFGIGAIRDFRDYQSEGGHPDFKSFGGSGEKRCVENQLDGDQKPVLALGSDDTPRCEHYTTQQNFNLWYSRDTPAVTKPLEFQFNEETNMYKYDNTDFYPINTCVFDFTAARSTRFFVFPSILIPRLLCGVLGAADFTCMVSAVAFTRVDEQP
jgi:hypothetical protein